MFDPNRNSSFRLYIITDKITSKTSTAIWDTEQSQNLISIIDKIRCKGFFFDLDIPADDRSESGIPGEENACAAWIVGMSFHLNEMALALISRGQVE